MLYITLQNNRIINPDFYHVRTYIHCRNLGFFSKKLDNYIYKLNKTFFIEKWVSNTIINKIEKILNVKLRYIGVGNTLLFNNIIIDEKYNKNILVVNLYKQYIKCISRINLYWDKLNYIQEEEEKKIVKKTINYIIMFNYELYEKENMSSLLSTDVLAFKRYIKLKNIISSF
jgi:hypothetical protein